MTVVYLEFFILPPATILTISAHVFPVSISLICHHEQSRSANGHVTKPYASNSFPALAGGVVLADAYTMPEGRRRIGSPEFPVIADLELTYTAADLFPRGTLAVILGHAIAEPQGLAIAGPAAVTATTNVGHLCRSIYGSPKFTCTREVYSSVAIEI